MPSDRASYTKRGPIGRGPTPLPGNIKRTGPHVGESQQPHSIANRGDTGSGRGTQMNPSLNTRRKAGSLPGAGRTPAATKPGV